MAVPVYIPQPASYSVLNATTGSFFAAIRDGTNPATNVRAMLPITRARSLEQWGSL
ncbi:MAG: hypothetical protein LBI19_07965 [Oscillospiraceae bacterium]|nr:hypothetical protein [Oscillospiraceae bacterium]